MFSYYDFIKLYVGFCSPACFSGFSLFTNNVVNSLRTILVIFQNWFFPWRLLCMSSHFVQFCTDRLDSTKIDIFILLLTIKSFYFIFAFQIVKFNLCFFLVVICVKLKKIWQLDIFFILWNKHVCVASDLSKYTLNHGIATTPKHTEPFPVNKLKHKV